MLGCRRHGLLNRRPENRLPVLQAGHLSQNRQITNGTDGLHRNQKFRFTAERLQKKEIHPSFKKCSRLLCKNRKKIRRKFRIGHRNIQSARTHRAGRQNLNRRCITGNLRRRNIDIRHLISQPESPQFDAVGPETVGLNKITAGLDIRFMNIAYPLRTGQTQLFKTRIHKGTPLIEHRPHRPITDENAFTKPL